MLYTTFRRAREAKACPDRYRHFARAVGGVEKYGEDTPIPLSRILTINGLADALWALRCVVPKDVAERDSLARLLACDYAEHVLPLYKQQYPTDRRPHEAIETARRFVRGEASLGELVAAEKAAWAAGATSEAAGAARAAWAAGAAERASAAEREWQARRLLERLEAGGD